MSDTSLGTTPVGGLLSKLAQLHRDTGTLGLMRHLRIVALQRGHDILERATQRRPDPTRGKCELSDLTISSSNAAAGVHYLPTPWAVLDALHDALPIDPAGWTFVDLGAGRGRAVLSAAQRPYWAVVGVEFAAELAAQARATLAAEGHHPPRVTIVEADAATVPLPSGPLVVFLFNPFGPAVLAPVVAALARHPAPVLIAYLNPLHRDVIANHPAFTPHVLPLAKRGWLAAISPYRFALYSKRSG
jgi:SAM-dependent methyltransferase